MLDKIIKYFNIRYNASINRLSEYIYLFENAEDNSDMLHPLLVACDMRMKVNSGYVSKRIFHGVFEKTSEFTNKYYDRIYENIDILSKEETFLLLRYPYLKESRMDDDTMVSILTLLQKIGYTIGKGDTSHLSDIYDKYVMDWRDEID